jgi:sodium pump decarboxylase gamma subunit
MSWPEILNVVITGMVVVFIALVLLIVVVMIAGKIFSATGKKNNKSSNEPQVTSSASAHKNVNSNIAREVENGIPDDVVAAITAAVSCLMTENGVTKPFAVKSIKRAASVRNVWRFAGVVDNTQPF